MKINRNNYEVYFLDYLDGSLEPGLYDELIDFLVMNPDLKEELESYENFQLVPEEKPFLDKQALKRNPSQDIHASNFENQCIKYIENELSKHEKENLLAFVATDEQKKHIFELYNKTKLLPNHSIKYDEKTSLKRFKLSNRRLLRWAGSIAASIIVLIAISNIVTKLNTNNYQALNDQSTNYNEKATPENISKKKANPLEINSSAKKHNKKNNASEKIKLNEQSQSDKKKVEKLPTNKGNSLQIIQPKSVAYLENKNEFALAKISTPLNKNIDKEISIQEFAVKKIKTDVLNLENSPSDYSLSFWDIIEAGTKSINSNSRLTIKLERENEDGKIKALAFNSKLFGLKTSFN